jgi:hypothetical protein
VSVVPVVDVRNPLETGREQSSDLLPTLGATPPRVLASREVEDGMIAEEGHDFAEIMPVEGVQKCLEHVGADGICCFHFSTLGQPVGGFLS